MTTRQVSPAAAVAALAGRDPAFDALVSLVGPPRLRRPQDSHFAALVRSILYQQLAGAAAAAIHTRLVAALGGRVEVDTVLALPEPAMRAAGLSTNKAASIRDLAIKVANGTVVLDPHRLRREPDEEVVARLSSVRGIGRWTAQMFLLFQLRRPDVWPTGDLGVRRGYGLLFDVPMPAPKQLEVMGDRFRPYRSVVAWYCWRACEVYARADPSDLTR